MICPQSTGKQGQSPIFPVVALIPPKDPSMKLLPLFPLLLLLAAPAQARAPAADWVQQKCQVYEAAWTQAVAGADDTQLNYAFIAANENFIAGGCTEDVEACPRSRTELEIANQLTLAMMNAGTASTFLPFRCPEQPSGNGWTGPGL
jgi:hypothetical protein